MGTPRALAFAALALLAGPAAAGEEDPPGAPALAAALRDDEAPRRIRALEAVLLRAREFAGEDEARLRAALERLLPVERDATARALAARVLGRFGGKASAEPLLRALREEAEPSPQAALVDSFADLPAEAVTGPLVALAFGDADPGVRSLAVGALARVPGEEPLRALLILLDTTHPWPVQSAALLGLGLRTDPRAVDGAVKALRSKDPALRMAGREAAEALLGEDLGDDPAAWEARWAAAREGWTRPRAKAPAAAGSVTTGDASAPRTAARFFDIPVAGGRVAFVADCSQSMWGPKIEAERAELEAAVKGLRSSQRFGVVFFNEKVWTWRDELVPATPAMKWDLCRRIPEMPTRSYTNIHDSLERAFGWVGAGRHAVPDPPGLDELFFLTDGEPNRGRTRDPDQIADAVRGWNGPARVRVHTVALGERPAAALLLRISRESGGQAVRR